MQWRQPPEREARLLGEPVEFGRSRSRGRGYLAHSDRVGQSVLILGSGDRHLADELNDRGFTALLPEGPSQSSPEAIHAAARFLTDNWHPRLGLLTFGETGAAAATALLEREVQVDVLILNEGPPPDAQGRYPPIAGHYSSTVYSPNIQRRFEELIELGAEVEVHVYEETEPGFWDRREPAFSEGAATLATQRIADALEYYLS
jgi:hypothetical protein